MAHHVHTPYLRMIMSYTTQDNKRVAKLIKVGTQESENLILRTLRWAAQKGVDVTFRKA